MKKTIIALSLLLLVTTTFAQEQEQGKWGGLPRHELSLGIGDCLIPNLLYSGHFKPFWGVDPCCNFMDFEDLMNTPTYHDNYYSTPVVSAGYLFRVTKFLWLGANVNWVGIFGNIYDATTDLKINTYRENQIAFLPTIRFSYLNKKYVTLYSGLSTGFVLSDVKNGDTKSLTPYFAGQLTAFGVSAGKNWFGYTEFGIGYKGFINAGFGCKFNSKK